MSLEQLRIGAEFGEAYVPGSISVERSASDGAGDFILPAHETLALTFDRKGYLDLHPVTDLRPQGDGLVSATDLAPRLRLWSVTIDVLAALPPYSDTPFLSTTHATGAMWNRFCRTWDPFQPPLNPPSSGKPLRAFEGWGPREPGSLAQTVTSLEVAGGRQADGTGVLLLQGTLGVVWRNSLGTYAGPLPRSGRFRAALSIPHPVMVAKGWRDRLGRGLTTRLGAPGGLDPTVPSHWDPS